MVDDKELAALVARDVFKLFDTATDKCHRVAAKGGEYPKAETDLGGLNEEALARVIAESLSDHRSY